MNTKNIQEDEIDLRELFLTLWNKRIFIVIFTTITTILSIIFVLNKTPIYEARAVWEIGSYETKEENIIKSIFIDNPKSLAQELNILYIDLLKNKKDRKSEISSIKSLKNQNKFLEIKSLAISNDLAIDEINKVSIYIQKKHKEKLDQVLNTKKFELKTIDKKINFIKNNKLVEINEKIFYQKNILLKSFNDLISLNSSTIKKYNKQLILTNKNLKVLIKTNSTLAAINIMEKRNIEDRINILELEKINLLNLKDELLLNTIPNLKRDKNNIIVSELETLYEEKKLLDNSMKSDNYKNTQIVGKIIVNDYAIKPKKTLIVIVSFITGLILSIILVFFINFIHGIKEDKVSN
ncbi:MAG: Wzz/FepE/Etk N-terminal domain-containing protein [Campylobacterales bacterium]|nr:Wzz/FepE/Etk N-terminal domain-containing protein [Campylobacterales bacterium]